MGSFGQQPLTIGEMQAIAQERGGECLSTRYRDSATKLEWRCKHGHQWRATPTSVKHGKTWCPNCSHNLKKTLADYRRYARKHDGKCLSSFASGVTRMATWQCRSGHRFQMIPVHVRLGHWCPRCALGKRAEALAAWRSSSTRANKSLSDRRP